MPVKIILDPEEVVNYYNKLKNSHKVAEIYGVSQPVIRNYLKLKGLTLTNTRRPVNADYFETIDTEEKAYWLGFIGADGCVRDRKLSGELAFHLNIKDTNHIKKLVNVLCPNAIIKETTSKVKIKDKNNNEKTYTSYIVEVRFNSKKLVKNLIKNGITPRKTFTINTPPIDEKYYSHFIRGFFDGDGCAYLKERKNGTLTLNYSISCASDKLKQFFCNQFIKSNIIFDNKDRLDLFIRGNVNTYNFYHYLYNDSTIYLERKKEKGDNFIKYFENKRDKIGKFNGWQSYHSDYNIDKIWTDNEIKTLYDSVDKYPWAYLAGTLIPNKTEGQIRRKILKLGIKHFKRRLNGERKIKEYLNNINK